MTPPYEYLASVLRVVDGDTVHLDVDLGIDVHARLKCRLYGINAPEMKTVEGVQSRLRLIQLLGTADATPVGSYLIRTYKDRTEKYGRYLVTIFRPNYGAFSINQLMIDGGFAVSYLPGNCPPLETL